MEGMKSMFKFSSRGVAEIYNTISMVLSHYITKESMTVQRMIAAGHNLLANHDVTAEYVSGKFNDISDILYTTTEEFKLYIVFSSENSYAEFRPSIFTDSKSVVVINIPKGMIYNDNDAKTDYDIIRCLFDWIMSYIAEDLIGGIAMMRIVEFFAQITIEYSGEEIYTDDVLKSVIEDTPNLFLNHKDGIVLLNSVVLPDVMERLIYE